MVAQHSDGLLVLGYDDVCNDHPPEHRLATLSSALSYVQYYDRAAIGLASVNTSPLVRNEICANGT